MAKTIDVDLREELNALPVGAPDIDEDQHFYACVGCGQDVDMRRLGDVLHHESEGHEPIVPDHSRPTSLAKRIATLEDLIGAERVVAALRARLAVQERIFEQMSGSDEQAARDLAEEYRARLRVQIANRDRLWTEVRPIWLTKSA